MRKLVVTQFVSLDGVMEGPGGENEELGPWTFKFDGGDGGFADKFNSMPKYVVSSTLTDPEWNNSHVVDPANLVDEVNRLKSEGEGDLAVHGSATLVQALIDNDLIDEYHLMLFPVVLGQGKKLFQDGRPKTTLKLVSNQPVGPD